MLHGYQQGIKPFWLIYNTVFCKTKMPMMRTECLVSTCLFFETATVKRAQQNRAQQNTDLL